MIWCCRDSSYILVLSVDISRHLQPEIIWMQSVLVCTSWWHHCKCRVLWCYWSLVRVVMADMNGLMKIDSLSKEKHQYLRLLYKYYRIVLVLLYLCPELGYAEFGSVWPIKSRCSSPPLRLWWPRLCAQRQYQRAMELRKRWRPQSRTTMKPWKIWT